MATLTNLLQSVSFSTPGLLVIALPLLALLAWQAYGNRKTGTLDFTGLEYLHVDNRARLRSRKFSQIAIRLFLVCGLGLILAGPVYRSSEPLFSQDARVYHRNFVVAFDMSPSMNLPASSKGYGGEDLKEGDGGVTRYEMARDALYAFIDRFPDERFGLILFSTEPFFARWPTTETGNKFTEVLESIRRGAGTQLEAFSSLTNIDKALLMASDAFEDQNGAIILISDAEDDLENLGRGVRSLRKAGIRLYTLGVGIPDNILANISREFAEDPGFRIFRTDSEEEMNQAYALVSDIEASPLFVDEARLFETDLRGFFSIILAIVSVILLGANEIAFHQTVSRRYDNPAKMKVSDGI